MELWVFDRSGSFICKRFDSHKHPHRFVKVILAYTMMSDEELGLNTFIKEDDIGKCIVIKGEGKAKRKDLTWMISRSLSNERLCAQRQPVIEQRG